MLNCCHAVFKVYRIYTVMFYALHEVKVTRDWSHKKVLRRSKNVKRHHPIQKYQEEIQKHRLKKIFLTFEQTRHSKLRTVRSKRKSEPTTMNLPTQICSSCSCSSSPYLLEEQRKTFLLHEVFLSMVLEQLCIDRYIGSSEVYIWLPLPLQLPLREPIRSRSVKASGGIITH